jgi:hypothetical protein
LHDVLSVFKTPAGTQEFHSKPNWDLAISGIIYRIFHTAPTADAACGSLFLILRRAAMARQMSSISAHLPRNPWHARIGHRAAVILGNYGLSLNI